MAWTCTWLPANHRFHELSNHSLAVDAWERAVLSQPNMDCCLESFWKYMLRDSTQKFIKNRGQDDKPQIQRTDLCLYICSNIRPWTDCFSPSPNLTFTVIMEPWCLRDLLTVLKSPPYFLFAILLIFSCPALCSPGHQLFECCSPFRVTSNFTSPDAAYIYYNTCF